MSGYFLWILFVISCFYPIVPGGFPYGFVAYPVLTILMVILSKVIFKKSFDSSYWKAFFVASIVFSIISCGLAYLSSSDVLSHLLNRYVEADETMAYAVESMLFNLGPFVFFVCYLINFIVRLVRHGKRKKEGDFPVQ